MDRTYRILVVEDNPADVLLIEEAFKECGYRCQLTVADGPAQARKLLTSEPSAFHLVISDYGGSERPESEAFIRMLRQDHPLVPVVVFSGYPDPRSAYIAGANAFVSKSGALDDFFGRVRETMRFWLDVALLPSLFAEHNR